MCYPSRSHCLIDEGLSTLNQTFLIKGSYRERWGSLGKFEAISVSTRYTDEQAYRHPKWVDCVVKVGTTAWLPVNLENNRCGCSLALSNES